MSGIQTKITKQVKKQEKTTHKEEKNQSVDTNSEMRWMGELVDQGTKTITTVLQSVWEVWGKAEYARETWDTLKKAQITPETITTLLVNYTSIKIWKIF